jgi:hypothetical protein
MSKRKGGKGKQRKRRSSGLQDHRRDKKVLSPPLLQLPGLKPTSWQQDTLPDFLWIQAVRDETGELPAANVALDVLDDVAPEASERPADTPRAEERDSAPAGTPPTGEYLDGRISSFRLIPEARRAEARAALRTTAPWALRDELGHALSMYPDCPASWLYRDWAEENSADPEQGLVFLKRIVASIYDPRGRPSSQVRMIPTARGFKHGRIFLVRGMEVIDLLPGYPADLTTEEQLHVEQWNRATSGARLAAEDSTHADAWAKHFWRQNWRISRCDPTPTSTPPSEDEQTEGESPRSEAPSDGMSAPVAELQRDFVRAINTLGEELRERQHHIEFDIYDPTADEVKIGLASRAFRLLRHVASSPSLWTNAMGPHVLRAMIDLRIVSAWLLKRNELELFQNFKAYGLGKRKLFKLQLEELMDRETLAPEDSTKALHERLEAEVNEDLMEELVAIDVGGNFSGKNIRQMADEAGLAELYSLSYQPLSTEAHGEWGSLVAFDLEHCGNPLHRYHRLGRFETTPGVIVHLGWIRNSFGIAEEVITDVFSSWGVSVTPLFEECLARLTKARDDSGGSNT